MDDETMDRALEYAHDTGFDEGYQQGYEDGWNDRALVLGEEDQKERGGSECLKGSAIQ